MDKSKLVLPISILLGCIILGVFISASEANKQKQAQQATEAKQYALQLCLDQADTDYLAYLKLNGTINADGSVWTTNAVSTIADKRKQDDKDNCFKQFK